MKKTRLMKINLIMLATTLLLSSCLRHLVKINKTNETTSSALTIKVTLDEYSKVNNWYYGTIQIKNKTKDTVIFNFNQSLTFEKAPITLPRAYEIEPSKDFKKYHIVPGNTLFWKVYWKTDYPYYESENINIKIDTTCYFRHWNEF